MSKKQTITRNSFGVELCIDGQGGAITSDLQRQTCPYCGDADCCFSCDESQAGGFATDNDKPVDDVPGRLNFNGALAAVERLILAHARAGIDVNSPAYLEGLESVVSTLDAEFNPGAT